MFKSLFMFGVNRYLLILASCSSFMLQGCGHLSLADFDRLYGHATPKEYVASAPVPLSYYHQVRPLLEQRCVVCHGCYDAPCQLKLESYEGLLRGAHHDKVYSSTRLLGGTLTRLFEDADTTAQWREKDFYPVLNERKQTPKYNLELGVMAQMLTLKQQHPLPEDTLLPETFDLALDRKQYCPAENDMADFSAVNPLWGMPYALPGLESKEQNLLLDWIANGAPAGKKPDLPVSVQQQLEQWEIFLNGNSLKAQLVSRYLFEHLFLAQLHFGEAPNAYFRMIRSSTPPGQPIQRISRARPFDDPGVARVYYRLWHDPSSIVAKTFMPYRLDAERMAQWRHWFIDADYEVKKLASYDPVTSANPFVTFADIPIDARYRFLVSEAQFTIMNFIKGPVCRGQVALNVIQDHFWVFFLDPKIQDNEYQAQFLRDNINHLQLPSEQGNTFRPLTNWIKYSSLQEEYLQKKANYLAQFTATKVPISLDMIWHGDGNNKNAALTIFRHSDSASVHQGLIGVEPKTAWVIGYPLLERIHYLLVAGFDIYGNAPHQLLTRLYMDFLRMEGEMNFINLMPEEVQRAEIESWYLNPTDEQKKLLDIYLAESMANTITYATENPKHELYGKLKAHLAKVLSQQHNTDFLKMRQSTAAAFITLENLRGNSLQWLPQTTLVDIPPLGVYSLIHNDAFTNLSSLFGEEQRRLPDADRLIFVKGFIGAYPNSFLRVNEADLPDLVTRIESLTSEVDYQALRDRYGIRRTSPYFWQFSDYLLDNYRKHYPDEYGLLDYNRLENR